MAPSAEARVSVRPLVFAYASMFAILVILSVAAQSLIQASLAQEIHERAVAARINDQELRTERMFYNVLLLQNPTGHGVNYLAIAAMVKADEGTWEAVGQAMYSGNTALGLSPNDFSPDALASLARARPAFLSMQSAYRHVLALEARDHPASPDVARPDVNTIYLGESPYLNMLIAVYSDHVSQADQYVGLVRIIELILFILAVCVVLPIEAFFVARPAAKQLAGQMDELANALQKGVKP